MSDPSETDIPADPVAARVVRRVRWLMIISGLTTAVAVAAVVAVIGYRLSRGEGSAAEPATVLLPKGARVLSTAVAAERIVVTIETAGAVEIRTFDLTSLRPTGRLQFATAP